MAWHGMAACFNFVVWHMIVLSVMEPISLFFFLEGHGGDTTHGWLLSILGT